ncbi:hypothetical protein BDF19DRAFT_415708 [Syncephalis fuscata]|nr:hypothetical protein BDF19DRAFT_415708 [Syncephalis fuscata]
MPIDYNVPVLGPEWEKNATYFLGISLYPLGEVQAVDHIIESGDDRDLMQKRMFGFNGQVAFMMIFGYIFAQNVYISIKMIVAGSRKLSSWCCLISSISGLILGILSTQTLSSFGLSCRILCWYNILGIGTSLVCCSAIILQKAYLVLCRPRWVLIVGIICILPQAGYPIMGAAVMRLTLIDNEGCVAFYPAAFPWYWSGSVLPINLLFSSIFSYVAYKQYKLFGSEAWKRLAQEGIQTMALVVTCNILCGISIFLEIGESFSEYFFDIDWLISSTILVKHCDSMRKIIRLSHRPRTEHIMHLSQIETVKTYQQLPETTNS